MLEDESESPITTGRAIDADAPPKIRSAADIREDSRFPRTDIEFRTASPPIEMSHEMNALSENDKLLPSVRSATLKVASQVMFASKHA